VLMFRVFFYSYSPLAGPRNPDLAISKMILPKTAEITLLVEASLHSGSQFLEHYPKNNISTSRGNLKSSVTFLVLK
jgi:hypothetical protein